MKRIFFALLCFCMVLTAGAQTKVGWSMKLGLGMSTWMGKDASGSSPLFNQKVGVGIDIPMTGLVSFQTGLMWESKGIAYDFHDNGTRYDAHCNLNYFQMPLLAAFHVGTPANFDMVFSAGGYLAYGVKGKNDVEMEDLTVSWDSFGDSTLPTGVTREGANRFDAGLQAGVALDFAHWNVGLDGEFGLCKVMPDRKTRNLAFYFTVGYKF